MQNKEQIKNCQECGNKLKRAKRSIKGLVKSCPSGCGFVLVHEQKWYSHYKGEW